MTADWDVRSVLNDTRPLSALVGLARNQHGDWIAIEKDFSSDPRSWNDTNYRSYYELVNVTGTHSMEAAEPDALLAALAYDVFVLRSNTFSKADLSRVAAQGAKPARSLSLDVRVRARLARPPARFGKAAT